MRPGRWRGTLGRGTLALATLAMGLIAAVPARAQKAQDTLRIVWWEQIANLNPYHNQLRAGLIVAHHVFDGLVYRDPETFILKPLLATAWRNVDATTLEFDLRRGVTFHDGSPFSADDVISTIDSVLNDPQVAVPANYAWIAGAEKIDDYKVRIRLKRVFPAATEYLAMVLPILPKATRERGSADAYDKLPVGAGPYRITRVEGTSRIDLERFEDYYDASPKGHPPIRRLEIHEVADAAAALEEIVGNKADWTWNVPPDAVGKLVALPYLQTTPGETMRVNYLLFDSAGRTGADNPLTKQKVRQAIAYAIDRAAISRNLMPGSRVLETPCYPTQFGCDVAAAVRTPYDPAKARALLAEAGYPNGFFTEMVSYQLPQLEEAVRTYLKAVGIEVTVTHLQVEAAIERNVRGVAPIYFAGWGSYSINDVSAFLPQLSSAALAEGFSPTDAIRSPELKALVQAGGASTNPDERHRAYGAAIRMITEQGWVFPMMNSVTTYAARKEVAFRPYPDELPRFWLASWR